MLRAALAASAVLLAGQALAQGRPSTLDMTCAEAAATVAQRGTLVANTGVHTFGLFVANGSFCRPSERAEAITAPTADNPNCRIGYTCRQKGSRSDN